MKLEKLETLEQKIAAQTRPAPGYSAVLDSHQKYQTLDFMGCLPPNHIMRALSYSIAEATYIPVHSVCLVTLSIYSAIACRKFNVAYENGATLPSGLYVVAEQPPGTGKSRVVNSAQKAFLEFRKAELETLREELATIDKSQTVRIAEIEAQLKDSYFVTNLTPESIDDIATETGGYFAGVSAEQGLFNSLFGASYGDGKASNNDAVLNGFSGDWYNSRRVKRNGYCGHIVGAVSMFAQTGGIEMLFKKSNETGLAERFLTAAEPHALGRRDFDNPKVIDRSLVLIYDNYARWLASRPSVPQTLSISAGGWRLIREYRKELEPNLDDDRIYAPNATIRGMFAKADMQVMKVAANLHLLSGDCEKLEINEAIIAAAIGIVDNVLKGTLSLCKTKQQVGESAEYTSILSLFLRSSHPRTMREIKIAKTQTAPFKEYTGNKAAAIEKAVKAMAAEGILVEVFNAYGVLQGYKVRA